MLNLVVGHWLVDYSGPRSAWSCQQHSPVAQVLVTAVELPSA